MESFMQRYASQIKGSLCGWDRLAFRGTLRWLASLAGLNSYLGTHSILYKDFSDWAQSLTIRIRQGAQRVADDGGIPSLYLKSPSVDKDALALDIARREGIETGPLCMFSVVEPSYSPTVVGNRASKRLELAMRQRRCVWIYFYFNDERTGLGHLRLQSWLPFTIKGCLNGRHWIERDLMRLGIDYIKDGNCFRWIADMEQAQQLADAQLRTDWPGLLNGFVDRFFPFMGGLLAEQMHYYWSTDATEWASDILFHNTRSLDRLFPMLTRHALIVSDSANVMRYLGKIGAESNLPPKIAGEIRGDRLRRHEGLCVKHRVDRNSVKMYNKAGNVLRVETTINNCRAFKVFRRPNDESEGEAKWLPMRKGVADLERRARLSQSSNSRYLDSLAACPSDTTFAELMCSICQRHRRNGRPVRALNPISPADMELLRFLAQGQWSVSGLRNRDLVAWLHPDASNLSRQDRRKLSARATRLLFILKTHGLIHKIPKTHRYRVTGKGQKIASVLLSTSSIQATTLMEMAA